mmetsp:Transcript_44113/g.138605  ORF Transcript_44113/g.138605 Transcript_44113/m.138605 type:complete len:211 (+) Transcript_44113:139-771(+)
MPRLSPKSDGRSGAAAAVAAHHRTPCSSTATREAPQRCGRRCAACLKGPASPAAAALRRTGRPASMRVGAMMRYGSRPQMRFGGSSRPQMPWKASRYSRASVAAPVVAWALRYCSGFGTPRRAPRSFRTPRRPFCAAWIHARPTTTLLLPWPMASSLPMGSSCAGGMMCLRKRPSSTRLVKAPGKRRRILALPPRRISARASVMSIALAP